MTCEVCRAQNKRAYQRRVARAAKRSCTGEDALVLGKWVPRPWRFVETQGSCSPDEMVGRNLVVWANTLRSDDPSQHNNDCVRQRAVCVGWFPEVRVWALWVPRWYCSERQELVQDRMILDHLNQESSLAWEDDKQRDNSRAVHAFESGDLPEMPVSACKEAEHLAARLSGIPVHHTAVEQNQAVQEWCEAHGQPDTLQVWPMGCL